MGDDEKAIEVTNLEDKQECSQRDKTGKRNKSKEKKKMETNKNEQKKTVRKSNVIHDRKDRDNGSQKKVKGKMSTEKGGNGADDIIMHQKKKEKTEQSKTILLGEDGIHTKTKIQNQKKEKEGK